MSSDANNDGIINIKDINILLSDWDNQSQSILDNILSSYGEPAPQPEPEPESEPQSESEPEPETEDFLGGTVQDGYIQYANGQLIDLSDDSVIEEFQTDYYGDYTLSTPVQNLPDFYKVVFTGGNDLATGEAMTGTLSNMSTKTIALSSNDVKLNISPITTLVSSKVEQLLLDTSITLDENLINNQQVEVSTALGISIEDMNADYIKEENIAIAKITQQIEVITNTISTAGGSGLNKQTIMSSLASTIQGTNFDLSGETNIDSIVNHVKLDTNITLPDEANVKQLIQGLNDNIQTLDTNTSFSDVITNATKITKKNNEVITANDFNFGNIIVSDVINEINDVVNDTTYTLENVLGEPESEPEPEPEQVPEHVIDIFTIIE